MSNDIPWHRDFSNLTNFYLTIIPDSLHLNKCYYLQTFINKALKFNYAIRDLSIWKLGIPNWLIFWDKMIKLKAKFGLKSFSFCLIQQKSKIISGRDQTDSDITSDNVIWYSDIMLSQFIKNNKQLVQNYCPISVLPVGGKILELIIYSKMFIFFPENELISHSQSGFTSGLMY